MNKAITVSNITKSYPCVLANSNVSLEISEGSIHAIVGENGAGKSTILHSIYGFTNIFSGQIEIDGKEIIELIEKGKTIYPKVYNLSLDNEHVYYANGYLVHNEKTWGGGDPGGSDGGIGWGSSLYDTTTSGW